MTRVLAIVFVCLGLAACSTERTTTTGRTATEQLLISAAADRAAEVVALAVPPAKKTFVVADNFEAPQDGKYAIGAIRAAILARGAALVADRAQAEQIVEIRSGALGIDNSDTIRITSYNVCYTKLLRVRQRRGFHRPHRRRRLRFRPQGGRRLV